MRKMRKRLLAWLMALAMVIGVIHVAPAMVVQADGDSTGITFGAPKFSDRVYPEPEPVEKRGIFTFPDVTVDMTGEKNA